MPLIFCVYFKAWRIFAVNDVIDRNRNRNVHMRFKEACL